MRGNERKRWAGRLAAQEAGHPRNTAARDFDGVAMHQQGYSTRQLALQCRADTLKCPTQFGNNNKATLHEPGVEMRKLQNSDFHRPGRRFAFTEHATLGLDFQRRRDRRICREVVSGTDPFFSNLVLRVGPSGQLGPPVLVVYSRIAGI